MASTAPTTLLNSALWSEETGFDTTIWSAKNLCRCDNLRLMSSEQDVEASSTVTTHQVNVSLHTDLPPRVIQDRKSISEVWLLRYGKESIKMLAFDLSQFVSFIYGLPLLVPLKSSGNRLKCIRKTFQDCKRATRPFRIVARKNK
jgi:hypothetical protein